MGFSFWLRGLLLGFLTVLARQNGINDTSRLLYHRTGNVFILGIFNDRFGGECKVGIAERFEEIAAAIWTVEALNNYNYLPGISIGLSVFGVCENFPTNKTFLELIEDHPQPNDSINMGVLTTREIHQQLKPLETFQNLNIVHIEHVIDIDMLTDLVVQLLTNLQWMTVKAVLADSKQTLNSFREKAAEEGIRVDGELLIGNRSLDGVLCKPHQIPPVIVVIAPFQNFSLITEKVHNETVKLILVPTDFVFRQILDLPKHTIVLLPSVEEENILSRFINNPERHREFFSHRGPTKSPLFIGTAASVLKLLKPIKRLVKEECEQGREPCGRAVDLTDDTKRNKIASPPREESLNNLPDDIETTLKVLKIEASPNDEMFLYIAYSVDGSGTTEDLAIFQIFSLKSKNFYPTLLMINDDILADRGMLNESRETFETASNGTEEFFRGKPDSGTVIKLFERLPRENLKKGNGEGEKPSEVTALSENVSEPDCEFPVFDGGHRMCQKFDKNQSTAAKINDTMGIKPVAVWRFLTWVSINTALCVIGALCTLSIMLFLVIRICRGYTLEGSPYFTLLLMLSVVLVYGSSLPFHVEFSGGNAFVCGFRINGPPVVFAILFSLLLSRSFMSAFSAGFVSHINGYLQSVLCVFMMGVQASITSHDWIHKKGFNCSEQHNHIIALGYNFILLVLLVCVCPFIIRSKRNYKEGLLFSISVFCTVVVWSVWISFYISLPVEHKDAAVAIGLNSTATVVLFSILIPRTYFLAGSIPSERTIRSLPYLDRNPLEDVSDSNYKSSKALNDSVFGTITYKGCEIGVSNPNFFSETNRAHGISTLPTESVVDITPDTHQPI